MILLALVLRFLDAMGAFPIIWGLLQGGPGTATETVGIYIYITTWQDFNVSLGAAQSYVVDGHDGADRARRDPAAAKGKAIARHDVREAARNGRGRMTKTQRAPRRHRDALRRPDRVGADRRLSALLDRHAPRSSRATNGSPGRRCIFRRRRPWRIIATCGSAPPRSRPAGRPRCRCRPRSRRCATASSWRSARRRSPCSTASIIAYAVSRYRLLSETRMFQLLMLRMVPPIVIVAPLSLYFSYIGLLDSLFGLGVALFPQQPALRGVDDEELYRRGAARGRAGGRDPRRLALAHRFSRWCCR